jgi:hypothetical protein
MSDIDSDMGRRLPFVDFDNFAFDLIAGAQLHRRSSM